MRNSFIRAIIEIGKDENVIILINDTGQFILQDFANRYPGRLINVGIAEQNMVGLAAGLAASGKTVFVYSIASFFARCYEQIKVDVAYHNLNVKLVGIGAGLAYGTMGITHHATEDIAIFRALPNMTIISPCDPIEAEQATVAAYNHPGPVYLRLGLTGEPNLHCSDYRFELNRIDVLRDGKDIAIISTGRMVKTTLEAADILKSYGVSAMVTNLSVIKPISDLVAFLVHKCKVRAILTIEEHNVIGGLGSAVAQDIARDEISIPFLKMGIYNQFCAEYGSWPYLQEKLRLSATHVVSEALKLLRVK